MRFGVPSRPAKQSEYCAVGIPKLETSGRERDDKGLRTITPDQDMFVMDKVIVGGIRAPVLNTRPRRRRRPRHSPRFIMVRSTIIVRASDALPLAASVDDEQVCVYLVHLTRMD